MDQFNFIPVEDKVDEKALKLLPQMLQFSKNPSFTPIPRNPALDRQLSTQTFLQQNSLY